jgi:hypothetical protein
MAQLINGVTGEVPVLKINIPVNPKLLGMWFLLAFWRIFP